MRKSRGTTFKRCGCRDQDGRLLGARCGRLKSGKHGTWYYQLRVPGCPSPIRKGGFRTKDDAEEGLARARLRNGVGPNYHAGKVLTSDYFKDWLAKKPRLSPRTRALYQSHIDLYINPAMGHVPLDELQDSHGERMFAAMRLIGRKPPTLDEQSVEYKRMIAARSAVPRKSHSAAQLHRVRQTLNSAVNAAVRQRKMPFNPMQSIELEQEVAPDALLWTPARVDEWRRTGKRPSKVMVWTPEQTGEFLDDVADDYHYPLFHLIAFCGLRAGEACGLRWVNVDLMQGLVHVEEQIYRSGGQLITTRPKAASRGTLPLDSVTVALLEEHRQRLRAQPVVSMGAWVDAGYVFPHASGEPLQPGQLTHIFRRQLKASGLPPIRLHDLRHGAASLAYAYSKDLKAVQALMRHKVLKMTADRYTHLFEETQRAIAEGVVGLVPRRRSVPAVFPQPGPTTTDERPREGVPSTTSRSISAGERANEAGR